uniref:Uncharacterized protein n=1 Tax=Strongyloides venezuelensis TaxID=75913 RepID=A0A0K0FTV5_STRVS
MCLNETSPKVWFHMPNSVLSGRTTSLYILTIQKKMSKTSLIENAKMSEKAQLCAMKLISLGQFFADSNAKYEENGTWQLA